MGKTLGKIGLQEYASLLQVSEQSLRLMYDRTIPRVKDDTSDRDYRSFLHKTLYKKRWLIRIDITRADGAMLPDFLIAKLSGLPKKENNWSFTKNDILFEKFYINPKDAPSFGFNLESPLDMDKTQFQSSWWDHSCQNGAQVRSLPDLIKNGIKMNVQPITNSSSVVCRIWFPQTRYFANKMKRMKDDCEIENETSQKLYEENKISQIDLSSISNYESDMYITSFLSSLGEKNDILEHMGYAGLWPYFHGEETFMRTSETSTFAISYCVLYLPAINEKGTYSECLSSEVFLGA